MSSSQNLVCSQCYKNIQFGSQIVCNVCQRKFHIICAKIDTESAVNALSSFANIVFNCDNCLQSSCDMVKKISLLSYEMEEMKSMLAQLISGSVNCNNSKNSAHRSLPLLKTCLGSMPERSSSPYAQSANLVINRNLHTRDDLNVNSTTRSVVGADAGVGVAAATTSATVSAIDVGGSHLNCVGDGYVDVDAVSVSTLGGVSLEHGAWENVTRRKQKKRRVVVGENNNAELDVVVKKRWVHLSSFKNTVTEDDIIAYVSKHLDVDKLHISCYKLVKKDTVVSDLKYVNFKLGVTSSFYDNLLKPDLWTADIKVRPFVDFPKKKPVQGNP